jgi:hypothetical protein
MRRGTRPQHGSIARAVRIACFGAVGVGCAAGVARADTVTSVPNGGSLALSQGFASTAPNQTPTTVTGTGANDGIGSVMGSNLTGNGNSTYLFNQSYANSAGSYQAGTLSTGNTFGLVSSYVVDLPNSAASAFVFSLNLSSSTGMDNLSARLYSYGPGQNTTLGITGALPNGGLVDPWSTAVNGGLVNSTTLAPKNVNAGLYVLELVGQLSPGATSGSYSGQLSIAPVPLPAAFPLLLSGIGGLVALARRRRSATVSESEALI